MKSFSIIKYNYQMQSPEKRYQRPLLFKQQLSQYVFGGPSDTSYNHIQEPVYTQEPFRPAESLFDRYNRNNLTLRECTQDDVIKLTKNIILKEDPLSNQIIQEISQKASKKTNQKMYSTGLQYQNASQENHLMATTGFHKKNKPSMEANPSKEYVQNQLLFNYKVIADQKKKKKIEFLMQVQAKIALMEKQAEEIQKVQEEEKYEIQGINRKQVEIYQELEKNVYAGKVKQLASQYEEEIEQKSPPNSLNMYMEPKQINQVLEEHYKLNEDLFDQIYQMKNRSHSKQFVKSTEKSAKSKEKAIKIDQKNKTFAKTGSSFGQTMKVGFNQNNKKQMISTMKCPPKSVKPKK